MMDQVAGPRRHHIVQLIETGGPGGAERVLVSLAERLAAGPDTTVSVGLLKEGWLARELRGRGLEPHLLALRHAIDLGFLRALTRHLRAVGAGLVHAHEFAMNLYGTLAGRIAGLPVVATVHGRNYYADAGRRVAAMRLLPRLGASVVAVSSDIRDFLVNELGVRPVRVIPNGIDVARYRSGDRAAARRALGIPDDVLLVGTVGNLYRVKGHAVLVEAVARLGDPRVHIAVAGRGEEERALRALAATCDMEKRLHLLGFRDDVPLLLAGFDLYALPSFSEGQSLALIEAMAAGLPIVATAVGGNPEILKDGEHGLLCPAGEAASLAACIGRLLAAPAEAAALGRAAGVRAEREFSLETMVRRYRALYAERGLGGG
ncbi:MAG: glycosyltransferase [Candidatus Eiseniibacteriota bacterium]|jgi:glycosyltransferase involved in cell wall biosynthesis